MTHIEGFDISDDSILLVIIAAYGGLIVVGGYLHYRLWKWGIAKWKSFRSKKEATTIE